MFPSFALSFISWHSQVFANIKHFKANYTIETWAKRNNPKLTVEQKNDPNTLYFMDYVGVYGVKKGPLSNE